MVATFSCFRFTPGLAFGEKDIGHLAITEYLSLTGQGKLRNRKIILERKQTFYRNSIPVRNKGVCTRAFVKLVCVIKIQDRDC
jgi:hypothetical protein